MSLITNQAFSKAAENTNPSNNEKINQEGNETNFSNSCCNDEFAEKLKEIIINSIRDEIPSKALVNELKNDVKDIQRDIKSVNIESIKSDITAIKNMNNSICDDIPSKALVNELKNDVKDIQRDIKSVNFKRIKELTKNIYDSIEKIENKFKETQSIQVKTFDKVRLFCLIIFALTLVFSAIFITRSWLIVSFSNSSLRITTLVFWIWSFFVTVAFNISTLIVDKDKLKKSEEEIEKRPWSSLKFGDFICGALIIVTLVLSIIVLVI